MARMLMAFGVSLFVFTFFLILSVINNQNSFNKVVEEEKPTAIVQVKNPQVDMKELSCMAKNIYHEARSEPVEGQIAVAVVTINRVLHSDFPDSVCDVVYQRNTRVCQFSWVCEGKKVIRDPVSYQRALDIARVVLKGEKYIDKLSNALYYHADYVRPRWGHKTKVAKIGRHIFYEYRA